jgi:hypothetical protein
MLLKCLNNHLGAHVANKNKNMQIINFTPPHKKTNEIIVNNTQVFTRVLYTSIVKY